MRETIVAWCSDDFVTGTIDDVGEVTYEERTYHVKVGQRAEDIIVGSHKEKIGTCKIKVGSHKVKTGTRQVKNPNKKWWSFWRDSYVTEDVYETVDDYKDEDVYKTVLDYKTVMRDIFEEKTDRIEKFSVKTSDVQTRLVGKLRMQIDNDIESALNYAVKQIDSMKEQFTAMFDELDKLIAQKYDELKACAEDHSRKEKELEKNRQILAWIEHNQQEMNNILEI